MRSSNFVRPLAMSPQMRATVDASECAGTSPCGPMTPRLVDSDADSPRLLLDQAIDQAIDLRTEAIDLALDQIVESMLGHRTVGEFRIGASVMITRGVCENRIGTIHSVHPDTGVVVRIGDCFSTFAPTHIAEGALVPVDDATEQRRRHRGRILTMAQAAELDRSTFEMYEELLGPEHPFTIGSAISLGVALHAQTYSAPSRGGPRKPPQSARGLSARGKATRRREGLALLEETLQKARQNLGWDHLQTHEAARRLDVRFWGAGTSFATTSPAITSPATTSPVQLRPRPLRPRPLRPYSFSARLGTACGARSSFLCQPRFL